MDSTRAGAGWPGRGWLAKLGPLVLPVLAAIAAATAAAIAFLNETPEYHATASLQFGSKNSDLGLLGGRGSEVSDPDLLAAAGAAQVTRDSVKREVRDSLLKKHDSSAISGSITVRVNPINSLVDIEAVADSGDGAADLANAYAQQTVEVANRVSQRRYERLARSLTSLRGDRRNRGAVNNGSSRRLIALGVLPAPVQVAKSADPPSSSVASRLAPVLIIAALLGGFLGTVVAILRARTRQTARAPGEVSSWLGLPIAGTVPARALGAGAASVNGRRLKAEDYERFWTLKQNVATLAIDSPIRSLLVTSVVAEEGKSTVSSWLARAGAGAGRRVVLVETDLRRPVLAARLGVEPTPGLTDFLAGDVGREAIIRTASLGDPDGALEESSFEVIPAGGPTVAATELLASRKFRDLMYWLATRADTTILDGPPILTLADAGTLMEHVDATLVCCRLGRVTREQMRRATLTLRPRSSVAAAVITGVSPEISGASTLAAALPNMR